MTPAGARQQDAIAIGGKAAGHGVFNNLGVALLNLDERDQAREAFSEAMRRAPTEMDSRKNLAMLSAQEGDHASAVSTMGGAVAAQPTNAGLWRLLGQLNSESQREREAQHAYARALALDPDDTEAQEALAQLDASPGSAPDAVPPPPPPPLSPPPPVRSDASTSADLRVTGTEADVQFLEGVIAEATQAQGAGDHAKASQLWATATRAQPDSAQLFMSRATSEYWASDMNSAAASYLTVVRLDPANFKARMYAGRAMHESRRYDESRAIFREAISVEPDNWEGYNMLGSQIMQSQNHTLMGEAVSAYKRAGQLQPRDPAPLVNLGHAYREADRLSEARNAYSAAVDMIGADNAEGEFAGRTTLADGLRIRMAGLLPRVIQSEAAMLASRGNFIRQITELASAEPPLKLADPPTEVGGIITFNLNYMGLSDRRIHRTVAELYEQAAPHLLEIAPHCHSPGLSPALPPSELQRWTASTDWSAPREHFRRVPVQPASVATNDHRHRRIRIGFVSANLKDHTIGKLFSATVVKLDRKRFDVTVFTFNGPVDEKSMYVQGHNGNTVVLEYKLAPARAAIAAAELDVLFYPDIGLDTLTYFLSFARLAPVQIMTWGHPVTSATRHMDYFISSKHLEPADGDDEYTETVVRLPHIPISFDRPQLPSDIAAIRARRSDYFPLGIEHADDAAGRINLYACPQSLFKFHPDFDEAIGRILAADPNGRLIIIHASSTSTELLQATVNRMATAIAAAVAVSDRANTVATRRPLQQLIVLPHQSLDDYFRLCGAVDVLLDTFPFGGGNTHYEALSTGTPVITLRTRQMRGRITPALYHRLNLASPEHGLVARSMTEYVQFALRMATDREANAMAREEILARVPGLYEDTVGIQELEQWLVNVSSYPREQ